MLKLSWLPGECASLHTSILIVCACVCLVALIIRDIESHVRDDGDDGDDDVVC